MAAMTAVPPPVREPAWSLSRSALGLWVVESVVSSAVLGIAAAAIAVFVPSEPGTPLPTLRWLAPVAVLLYAVVAIGVRPWFKHRVYRWEITADAAFTRTGWLSQTWTLVPISRIQTVDVTRGLLQQAFGLATVAVLTASSQGTVRIHQLEHDVAQRVAADLAARGDAVRDEAT